MSMTNPYFNFNMQSASLAASSPTAGFNPYSQASQQLPLPSIPFQLGQLFPSALAQSLPPSPPTITPSAPSRRSKARSPPAKPRSKPKAKSRGAPAPLPLPAPAPASSPSASVSAPAPAPASAHVSALAAAAPVPNFITLDDDIVMADALADEDSSDQTILYDQDVESLSDESDESSAAEKAHAPVDEFKCKVCAEYVVSCGVLKVYSCSTCCHIIKAHPEKGEDSHKALCKAGKKHSLKDCPSHRLYSFAHLSFALPF